MCVHGPIAYLSLQMAKAGFVHCPSENEPDVACCFFCLRELEGWEPQDDPRYDLHCVALSNRRAKFEAKNSLGGEFHGHVHVNCLLESVFWISGTWVTHCIQ